MAQVESQVKVTFRLPEDLYDVYAERAAKTANSPESEIIKTLSRCRSHNAASPLYLDDAARNALSQITGKLMASSDSLVGWARETVSIKVQGAQIQIHPQTLKRLQSRCFGGITMTELLQQIVPELLETYVGLR